MWPIASSLTDAQLRAIATRLGAGPAIATHDDPATDEEPAAGQVAEGANLARRRRKGDEATVALTAPLGDRPGMQRSESSRMPDPVYLWRSKMISRAPSADRPSSPSSSPPDSARHASRYGNDETRRRGRLSGFPVVSSAPELRDRALRCLHLVIAHDEASPSNLRSRASFPRAASLVDGAGRQLVDDDARFRGEDLSMRRFGATSSGSCRECRFLRRRDGTAPTSKRRTAPQRHEAGKT